MFEIPENAKIILALVTILVVFIVMLWRRNVPTEVLFTLALVLFVVCDIIPPNRAWQGYADPAVIAIAGLLIVSAALRTSGVLDQVGRTLLGSVKTEVGALRRLAGVIVAGSAFLLNTAIVAMLLPLVISWCRRRNIAPSRILLPVSYLAILGGTCTLLGTSTNFVINGTLKEVSNEVQIVLSEQDDADPVRATTGSSKVIQRLPKDWLEENASDGNFDPMRLTDISWVGIPCALAGTLLLLLMGRRMLPDRLEMLDSLEEHRREYLVEMVVASGCSLVGKTVEEGGLRHLPGLFLIEIDRDGQVIGPVAPSDRIAENDRLVFTGVVATIVDLEKIPGLIPAADFNYEISPEKGVGRSLVEVVLSPSSPLVGSTIRQANFRQHYGAAVVAVHRNGERLPTKIGDIELTAGDTLLLQTQQGFVRNFRNRPDFYLVSGVEESDSRRYDKRWLAVSITVGMIVWLFFMRYIPATAPAAWSSAPVAIIVAAMMMLVTRCVSVADARRAIDLPMLLTVGAAIGVGRAVSECGAASQIAEFMLAPVGGNAYLGLAIIFVTTVCFTEMISNVAVAAIMFFVAIELASQLGASPRPFIMAVTLGASLSFISPIGYQTNLMVMGPGGYRPIDYVRAGLPLSLVVGAVALVLIPIIWHF